MKSEILNQLKAGSNASYEAVANRMRIVSKIDERINELNWQKETLAKKLKISNNDLTDLLSGTCDINQNILKKISKILNIYF